MHIIQTAVLQQAAEAVRTIGATGQERQVKLAGSASRQQVALYTPDNPIPGLDSAAKVALLNRVEQLAKAADPRIVQVMAGLTCEHDLIYLARLDGITAAEKILQELSCAVVMLTAFSQSELVERARDAGAMAYVVKPFSPADLVPAVGIARPRSQESKASGARPRLVATPS